jgi:hypothetical protein
MPEPNHYIKITNKKNVLMFKYLGVSIRSYMFSFTKKLRTN